ncbi:MAG: hypothetical protein ABSB87_15110, partial [Terriglobales bacterium]
MPTISVTAFWYWQRIEYRPKGPVSSLFSNGRFRVSIPNWETEIEFHNQRNSGRFADQRGPGGRVARICA